MTVKHRRRVEQHFSSLSQTSLTWLRVLLAVLLCYLLAWVGYHIVEIYLYPAALYQGYYYPFWTMLVITILVIGYRSLLQPEINYGLYEAMKQTKYQSSGVSEDEIQALARHLKALIHDERLYLNAELRLADLSTRLDVAPHILSQVLSQGLATNFYDLINTYRVEVVKQRLNDAQYQNQTMLALAFDAGFNSKTTFYNAFKKHTGMSPREYQKRTQEAA